MLVNDFIVSGGKLSIPPALPFFRCLIEVVTSVQVIGPALIPKTCPFSIDDGSV